MKQFSSVKFKYSKKTIKFFKTSTFDMTVEFLHDLELFLFKYDFRRIHFVEKKNIKTHSIFKL